MFQAHFITIQLLKWMKLSFFSMFLSFYLFIIFFCSPVIFLANGNIHRGIWIRNLPTSLSYKKERKGSEMFAGSIQITKLLSSWNRYCTLVWLHHIPDSLHFAILSLQPPFPGAHPHLICTFQRAEQAAYIFLFQSSNLLLDLTQRSISLSETSFGPHSNHFQNTAKWDSESQWKANSFSKPTL